MSAAPSSSSTLQVLVSRLNAVETSYKDAFDTYLTTKNEDYDDEEDEENLPYKKLEAQIQEGLRTVCDVARYGAQDGKLESEDLGKLLDKASSLESHIIFSSGAMGDEILQDTPISCGNEVRDESMGKIPGAGIGAMLTMMSLLQRLTDKYVMNSPNAIPQQMTQDLGYAALPYKDTYRPGPQSTLLARFSEKRPTFPSPSPPLLAFSEARCEIASSDIPNPIRMVLSGGILATLCQSGWKERDPYLQLMDINSADGDDFSCPEIHVPIGLSSVAGEICLDAEKKRVYVADSDRVKSYQWSFGDGDSLPVHTLKSDVYRGPMTLADSGSRLIRSGSKGIALWDLDSLPTHVEGEAIIGEEMEEVDSWRDNEDDEVERSTGSVPSQTVDAPALAGIDVWAEHPGNPKNMLVARRDLGCQVWCASLETQQVVTRFVGHNSGVSTFATSSEDAGAFLTASDGGVRFYDARIPAPVFVIDHHTEPNGTVLYKHIGGHPFAIIGGTNSQQVKIWDLRARLPLYELSTGNNGVTSLAWDAERQDLYAATYCQYMTRMGDYMGYRKAKFGDKIGDEEDEDDDYDDDDDDYDDEPRAWPEGAYHREFSFGHPLDSGEHRIYRYRFKPDADVSRLPAYGQATIERDGGMFGF